MMKFLVAVALLAVFGTINAERWALIVAGSNGWGNYRHQADACHAYQVVSGHGIPDSNIVVMMYDDIANHSINPYPGKIINEPKGKDVYAGVPKDYTKRDVTPENFLKVLAGEEMKVGSGKTIKSGPDDEVFVFFSDHGATGLIAFPSSELHMKDLNKALLNMHIEKKFAQLVFYLEACESGSMFRNVLPKDIGVYAMTASDYDESSWGCFCDEPDGMPCLGDLFSVSWLQDSDKENLNKESLGQQHTIVKTNTNKSRVMQYGDLKWQSEKVSMFQGDQMCEKCQAKPERITGLVSSRDIPLFHLQRQISQQISPAQRESALKRLSHFMQKRLYVDDVIKQIVSRVMTPKSAEFEAVMTVHPIELKEVDCHHLLTQHFSRRCFSFALNEYVMKYSRVLANLCESGVSTMDLMDVVYDVCTTLTDKPTNIQ
jgi:legumain